MGFHLLYKKENPGMRGLVINLCSRITYFYVGKYVANVVTIETSMKIEAIT